MRSIGAYEAKTHLSSLLERVQAGERIIITRHGTPVAEITAPANGAGLSRDQAIQELRRFREQHTLGVPLRELIDEGRR